MATTPLPSRMSTKVPRNSAINSAVSVGFGFIRISGASTGLLLPDREVVYQAAAAALRLFAAAVARVLRLAVVESNEYGAFPS